VLFAVLVSELAPWASRIAGFTPSGSRFRTGPEDEIPETIDSPSTGLPAGRDRNNPPSVAKLEPYKTHLAYVKERRTEKEAAELLEEALEQLRARRGSVTK
jgi:hypothetical protein